MNALRDVRTKMGVPILMSLLPVPTALMGLASTASETMRIREPFPSAKRSFCSAS